MSAAVLIELGLEHTRQAKRLGGITDQGCDLADFTRPELIAAALRLVVEIAARDRQAGQVILAELKKG